MCDSSYLANFLYAIMHVWLKDSLNYRETNTPPISKYYHLLIQNGIWNGMESMFVFNVSCKIATVR